MKRLTKDHADGSPTVDLPKTRHTAGLTPADAPDGSDQGALSVA